MHIVVCLKQVFSTPQVRINPETNAVIREGGEWIINPFDEHALETALALKDTVGAKVTVITAGSQQAEAVLREALARGADAAVLLSDAAFEGSDAWATAKILAAGIQKVGAVDLIVCGKQTMDGDTAQVGPAVAEFLGWPCVTYVRKLAVEGTTLKLERLFEDGFEKVEVVLPAVLTVGKEINTPRMASLKGRMAAKKAQIAPVNAAALGLAPESVGRAGSPTRIVKMATPPKKTGGIKIDGSDAAAAAKTVVEKLRELKLV
ncbi:MAG: electron transfer flavoprotein subunit beta/FixA family protein [Verrucomicrobia bacterium]|nr:MAG: electron transfer flavoprotein subunit beta/FixA family protein [Verrucomicrobiota bacterium]